MSGPSPAFTDLVRDALLHLYDVGHLQTHPLQRLVERTVPAGAASGPALRQALLNAIEAVRPGPDVAPAARAWRLYHILERRYIECHDVAELIEQVALSSAQYHREHQRALQMVAVLLWERWAAERPGLDDGDVPWSTSAEAGDSVQREAAGLVGSQATDAIDAGQVVRELQPLLAPLCAGRAIEIELQLPATLPAVAGERVALRHLLLVLLSHLVSASGDGRLLVRLASRPRQVVLTLSGPPLVEAAQLERGLSESRPFADALGVTISHQPGASARWSIRVALPVADRPRLLVVDNNADFVRLIERYLTGADWTVLGATTVAEAARLARERHPDLILLDVIIPQRDGWDLLLELSQEPTTAEIPVIVCSVLQEPAMATALGATAYLPKPVSRAQLLAAITPFR